MIRIENIRKSFDDVQVLKGISHTFESGKTNLIIGKSGAGKTVMLKILVLHIYLLAFVTIRLTLQKFGKEDMVKFGLKYGLVCILKISREIISQPMKRLMRRHGLVIMKHRGKVQLNLQDPVYSDMRIRLKELILEHMSITGQYKHIPPITIKHMQVS